MGCVGPNTFFPAKEMVSRKRLPLDRRKYFKPQVCEGVNNQTLKAPAQQMSDLTKTGLEGKGLCSFGEMLALETSGPEFRPEKPCEEH